MESPDRNSPSSAGEIQGSPLFNFLCSLSPIKSVKSAHVAQTYSEISFPPPPAVFVSPRVDARKESSSLQSVNGVEGAQTTSEIGPEIAQKEGKCVPSSSQRIQKLRSLRNPQKNQSFPSPCSSPSKLVEDYLAEPVDEDLGAEEDELEMPPDSSTCETRATRGDTNSLCMDGMEFGKQEEIVLKALPKLSDRNASYMGQVGLTGNGSTQDARASKSCSTIFSSKHVAHQSGDVNNEAIMDFHQEAADLEFLMSEGVDESHHHSGMENWHNVTSSGLSELSVEQVEGYIASLRGIVNEEQGMVAGFSTRLSTEVVADESLTMDNLEAEPEAQGSQGGAVTCKVTVPQQRGVRRRCLDFEVSEGHKTDIRSLRSMPSASGTRCLGASSCGAESNRSLLVLKKRVSATMGAMNHDSAQGNDACTGCCLRKDGTASIKMTRATSINIKLSRSLSFKDGDNGLPCAKASSVPAGMPSGIGLHLNSLTSSMPCTQMREIDGSSGSITSLKPGNSLLGGMVASKMQGSPAEGTQKCLVPLNPGKHAYTGSSAESKQGLVALVPEARMDDCEVQSECSDQDIDSSNAAICVQSASLGSMLVHDVVPSNILNKRPSPLGRKRILLQDKHYQGDLAGGEETNQSPHSPKKKRRWSATAEKSGDGCKRCNCKKSKCLKLYCECFAAGVYCVDSCTCQGCFNKPEFKEMVMDTRQQIESRNPLAFAPKIIRASESSPTKREDSRDTPASARHKRGCNCKKSHCLKKYCECFQAGVGCSDGCRCESCKNVHGRKEGSQDSDENEPQVETMVNKEFAEEHISTSEFGTELIHGSHHQNHELSPITPSFQHGGQHRPTIKSSSAIKRRSPAFSLSSCRSPLKLPRSPSRLLRSCKGAQNSPPMTSTGTLLPRSGSSPVSTPRILRIGQFSPRWDGLDEICTLTPGIQAPLRPTPASASVLDRTDTSPSINEQNCNKISTTGNGLARHNSKFSCLTSPISQQQSSQSGTLADTQGTPGIQTPFSPVDNKPFYEESKAFVQQFIEDNGTPEFLKDPEPEYLPICLLNSSSPKHKRVSPPHHHALREVSRRGMQSPGVRSSRKFILQSIPSVPPTLFIAGHEKPNEKKCHKAEA